MLCFIWKWHNVHAAAWWQKSTFHLEYFIDLFVWIFEIGINLLSICSDFEPIPVGDKLQPYLRRSLNELKPLIIQWNSISNFYNCLLEPIITITTHKKRNEIEWEFNSHGYVFSFCFISFYRHFFSSGKQIVCVNVWFWASGHFSNACFYFMPVFRVHFNEIYAHEEHKNYCVFVFQSIYRIVYAQNKQIYTNRNIVSIGFSKQNNENWS